MLRCQVKLCVIIATLMDSLLGTVQSAAPYLQIPTSMSGPCLIPTPYLQVFLSQYFRCVYFPLLRKMYSRLDSSFDSNTVLIRPYCNVRSTTQTLVPLPASVPLMDQGNVKVAYQFFHTEIVEIRMLHLLQCQSVTLIMLPRDVRHCAIVIFYPHPIELQKIL